MPFWLFRAVFLLPRPYEITSLKSNIVKSIEAYYMYSILLPFFYLFFFLVYDLKLLHNHMKFISMCPLFACPGIDLYYLYEIQAIMILFFVITHTCAQTIRELRFWWKSFLRLPVQWCKWHINIVSDFL